jgi:alpha amylase-like protein
MYKNNGAAANALICTSGSHPPPPSAALDDGYDIADYPNVHSTYGTLLDFEAFLRQAHRLARGRRLAAMITVCQLRRCRGSMGRQKASPLTASETYVSFSA